MPNRVGRYVKASKTDFDFILNDRGEAIGVRLKTGDERLFEVAQVPLSFSSRALNYTDDNKVLVPVDASQTATINTGLPEGFGCSFNKMIAFNGTATVTDKRTSGAANPFCTLVNVGLDQYDVIGGKV